MSAEPVSRPVTDPPIPLRPKFLTRPASEDPKDTGFERRPMVDWLAPGQLIRTGIKSVLSGVFGAYADKRDVMAALDPEPEPHLYSDKEEIWIDYVADLGDGFDATYSLATLLASPGLTLGGQETRRGEILVMGGDQVYPTASWDEYHNRLLMPYKAALPCVLEGSPPTSTRCRATTTGTTACRTSPGSSARRVGSAAGRRSRNAATPPR